MERAAKSAESSPEVARPPVAQIGAAVAVEGGAAHLAPGALLPELQGGRPLPVSTRSRLEASFGQPLDGVRIHDDARAAELSAAHNADAFTLGDHVAFAAGRFAPGTPSGDHLLAHEIAHVVQQRGGGGGQVEGGATVSRPHEAVEVEAEAAAHRFSRGEAAAVSARGFTTRARILRQNHGPDSSEPEPVDPTAFPSSLPSTAPEPADPTAPPSSSGSTNSSSSDGPSPDSSSPTPTADVPTPAPAAPSPAAPAAPASSDSPTPAPEAAPPEQAPAPAPAPEPAAAPEIDVPPPDLGEVEGEASTVLEAIQDASEDGRDDLMDALDTALEKVADAFSGLSDHASETADTTVETGSAAFSSAREAVLAIPETERPNLSSAADAAAADALSWTTAEQADAVTLFTDTATEVEDLGRTQGEEAQTSVEGTVTDGESAVGSDLTQAEGLREGGGGDEDAQLRADAANQIVDDTVDKLGDLKDDIGEFHGEGDDLREEFEDQGTELGEGLTDQSDSLSEQIGELGEDADERLHDAADDAADTLDDAASDASSALSDKEDDWSETVSDSVDTVQDDLETRGEDAVTELQTAAEDTVAAGDVALTQAAGELIGATLSEEDATALAAEASTVVTGAYSDATLQIEGGVDTAVSEVDSCSSEIDSALDTHTSELSGALDETVSQTETGASDAVVEAGGGMDDAVTTFTESGDGLLDEVSTKLDERVDELQQEFDDKRATVETKVDEGIDPPVAESHEAVTSLPTRISTAQSRAAERKSRSWLSNQLSDLWDLLSDPGFWAALVVGIVLTIVVILLAPEELGLLAIIAIGAAIGAISMLVGYLVSSWWKGAPITWSGVLEALLTGALLGGLAALLIELIGVGIAGYIGIALFAGVSTIIINLIHGDPWDKNLLANMILAPLMLLFGKWLGGRLRPKGAVEEPPVVEDPEGPPGGCFAPGTLVHTVEGLRPIETLQPGDRVWARVGDETVAAEIRQVFVYHIVERYTLVVGRSVIVCSGDHPFYVAERGWVKAAELTPGDLLIDVNGLVVPLIGVSSARLPSVVHNIEVSDPHRYHVGEDGLLVHNKPMRYLQSSRAAGIKAQAEELPQGTRGRQSVIDEAEALRVEAEANEAAGQEPKPEIDARLGELETRVLIVELDEFIGPRGEEAEAKAFGSSDKLLTGLRRLQSLREGLTEPEAIRVFDEIVQKQGAFKALKAFEGMGKGEGGLEKQLLKRAEESKPPTKGEPFGDAIEQARTEQTRADALKTRIDGLTIDGAPAWNSRLKPEAARLQRMLDGIDEASSAEVQSVRNNIDGIEAEINDALARGAGQANAKITYGGGKTLDIDNISPDGKTWTEVKNKEPFGSGSSAWTEEVQPKAQKMIEAGNELGVSDLRFSFPKGVSQEVAGLLEGMGFKVEGTRVAPPQ